jgi:hypothetical protein
MAIDFPSAPTLGQQYVYSGVTYTFTAQGVWAASPAVTKAAFIAVPAGDQSGIANETWTKVNFATAQLNDSSLFNVSSSRWVPPAGRCQICGAVGGAQGALLGTPIYAGVYKNGALYRATVGAVVSNIAGGSPVSIIDTCSGTDYYELWTYGYAGTTFTVSGSTINTYFMGNSL